MRLRKRETYHWCQHLIPGYQLLCFLSSPLLTALGRHSKTSQIHGPPHPPGSPRCNSRFLALTSPGWGVNPTNERSCFIPLSLYILLFQKQNKKKKKTLDNKTRTFLPKPRDSMVHLLQQSEHSTVTTRKAASYRNPCSCLLSTQNGRGTGEGWLAVSHKTEHTLGPAVVLTGIYPKKLKTHVHTGRQGCL